MAVITRYCLKKKKLTRIFEKRCNLLWLLTLNSTLHVLNRAAYPYRLSRLISFDLISPLARRPEPQIGESAYPVSPIGNFGTLR